MSDTLDSGPALSSAGSVTSDDIAAVAKSLDSPAEPDSSSGPPESDAPSGAATTAPPSPPVPAPSSPGPIPFERHEAALRNAREKAKAEVEAELKQRFAWAERYQPDQVEQASRLYEWLSTNPQGFRDYLDQQLQSTQPKVEDPPAPDLKAEDGTPVYSAPQLSKFLEWQRKQMLAEVQQAYEPIKQQVELDRLERQSKVQATTILTEARQHWPEFPSLEGEIKSLMLSNPALTLHDAYIAAFRQSGVTKLRERWKQEYEGALADKQAAGTTRPGVPATTPRKFSEMNTREIVESVYQDMVKSR